MGGSRGRVSLHELGSDIILSNQLPDPVLVERKKVRVKDSLSVEGVVCVYMCDPGQESFYLLVPIPT